MVAQRFNVRIISVESSLGSPVIKVYPEKVLDNAPKITIAHVRETHYGGTKGVLNLIRWRSSHLVALPQLPRSKEYETGFKGLTFSQVSISALLPDKKGDFNTDWLGSDYINLRSRYSSP